MNVEKHKFLEAVRELTQHCDINYRSCEESQTTLLMLACSLNEYSLVELLINQDYSSNLEKGDKRLNMSLKDANSRGILHHLLSLDKNVLTVYRAKSEYNAEINILHIFNFLTMQLEEDSQISQQHKKRRKKNSTNTNFNLAYSELTEKDCDGHTSLSLCLVRGYYTVAKQIVGLGILKSQAAVTPTSVINKFNLTLNCYNLLHCAVLGKNINNLFLILSYSTQADLLHKSKDNLTPADLAKSLGLHYFHRILKFFENNISNPLTPKYFHSNSQGVIVSKLLTDIYLTEKYDEAMFVLDKLKLSNSLGDLSYYSSVSTKDSQSDQTVYPHLFNDYSIAWNILISQYSQFKKSVNDQTKQLKKDDLVASSKAQTLLSKLSNFFSQLNPLQFEHYTENPNLLLLLFNKNIFYYKTSNFAGCIKTSSDILTYVKATPTEKIEESFSFFLFINTSFILIDILLSHNLVFLASIFIERIDSFLAIKYREKNSEQIEEHISKYLTNIDYLHSGTKTWDETFAMLCLVKAHRDLISSYNELKSNEATKYLSQYESLEMNCKYKSTITIFKGLQTFYDCIKTKTYYLNNNVTSCSKILMEIYQKSTSKDTRITINGSQFDLSVSNPKEVLLFYFNTQGILLLKQKKYNLAEFYFRKAIDMFETTAFNQNKEFNFLMKLGTLMILNFNLGLSYFYQKEYEKARSIFSRLCKSTNSQIVNYPYTWFRYGLCCLELFISKNYDKVQTEASDLKDESDSKSQKASRDDLIQSENLLFKQLKPAIETSNSFNNNVEAILLYKVELSEIQTQLLSEAVACFKQVLVILNQDLKGNHLLCGKSLFDLFTLFSSKPFYDDSCEYIPLVNSNYKTKNYSSVVISTYLNLLFSLVMLEKWNEVLFYSNDFQSSDYYNLGSSFYNSEIQAKINSYKIQAYLNLSNYSKAHETISLLLSNDGKQGATSDFKAQFFGSNSRLCSQELSFRESIQISLIKYYFAKQEMEEGDKLLSSVIASFVKDKSTESAFPICLLNYLIYSLLYKGMHDKVLKIVKYNKVFEVLKELNIIKLNI